MEIKTRLPESVVSIGTPVALEGPCAWETGIYRGKNKRATSVNKEPGAVGLNVSMLAVRVSSALMTMVVKTSGT